MVIALIIGFLIGAITTTIIVIAVARRRMIQVLPSPHGTVEETVAALERGIGAAEGWSSPGVRDLNGMMARHGVQFAPKVRLVEMCKARHAAEVLRTDRHVATLMPCAVAVYEDDTGRVWLSKLNLELMGPLMGGNVGRVMGGPVAKEEKAVLAALRG